MADLRKLVIYHIFIDRFSRGKKLDGKPAPDEQPVFCGGNIQGIIDHLDHIQNLGVNAIWLSPFMKTSAYHGYHTTDFFSVEERFGTLEKLKQLIRLCHQRNILMFMDFVPNHASHQHPYFLDAQQKKDSKYKDWFTFTKWPNEYVCFLDFKELPKLNLENKECRAHIISAAKYWLDQGIDGLRIDHAVGPSHDFWRAFVGEVKQHKPSTIIIGEVWWTGIKNKELHTVKFSGKWGTVVRWWLGGDPTTYAMQQYEGLFDGLLDFGCHTILKEAVAHKNLPVADVQKALDKHYAQFSKEMLLFGFLDNHDMNRFLLECGQDKEKLKKAAQLLLSQDQPSIIYYGTEIGMSQEVPFQTNEPHADLRARKMMDWDNTDTALLAFYKKLVKEKTKR